jgi:hypothetical protein
VRRRTKLASEERSFKGVLPAEGRAGCVWEYARESPTLRKKFHGVFNVSGPHLVPWTLETNFLAAMHRVIGGDLFLSCPWVRVTETLRRTYPETKTRPIVLLRGLYAAKAITGPVAVQEMGYVIVKIGLYEDKRDVLEAVGQIFDHGRKHLPSIALDGRPADWMARLEWLGAYRLKRAGYPYKEMAQILGNGQKAVTASQLRQLRRAVASVPLIFQSLFPFLPPLEPPH